MKHINFSRELINKVCSEDLFDFMKSVMPRNSRSISVVDVIEGKELSNNLMTTITITFQEWNHKESGIGTKYSWKSYRAKDFCCKNIGITLVL